MKYYNQLKSNLKTMFSFDIRDILYFGGLGMLGYGIYLQWGQGPAYIACGSLLLITGYLMRDK